MKALIWIGCIIGASVAQVILNRLGIVGAIPAMLVFVGMWGAGRTLCKAYERKKKKCNSLMNEETASEADITFDTMPEVAEETVPQAEDLQVEPLFKHAYNAYMSENPEEKQFFENLLGSPELKAAYLEECKRNKCDKGACINCDQSYMDFMKILCDEYGELSQTCGHAVITNIKDTPLAVERENERDYSEASEPKNGCEKAASSKKRQSSCKFKYLHIVLALLGLLVAYVGVNYWCAISAMNNQEFIKSQQYFDNILVSETVFRDKYAYVKAGVLMEEGKYVDALYAFDKVKETPLPAEITNLLELRIYSEGKAAYKAGEMIEAKKCFSAINPYQRSEDYLFLIDCSGDGFSGWSSRNHDYDKLVRLLGFENVDEIIIENTPTAERFLKGRWEDGSNHEPYFFELQEEADGSWYSRYNLPCKDVTGYFFINDAVYSIGDTESSAVKCYRFSIVDEDTILIYCYKDGSTHRLLRQ